MSDFELEQYRAALQALDGPHADNDTLYNETVRLIKAANFPDATTFAEKVLHKFGDGCLRHEILIPHPNILSQMAGTAAGLYASERLTDLPPSPWPYGALHGDTPALGALRDVYLNLQHKAKNPQTTLNLLTNAITAALLIIANDLPLLARYNPRYSSSKPDSEVCLTTILPNVGQIMHDALDIFEQPAIHSAGLFRWIRQTIQQRIDLATSDSTRSVSLLNFAGSSDEFVETFLKDTPFERIFLESAVPVFVPPELLEYQHKLPIDPSHPKHHCYQCRRPLPADFAIQHWQERLAPTGPFFHTEQCKNTALKRYQTDDNSYEEAYGGLVKEYRLYVNQYEDGKRLKEEVELRKAQEAQERREERDHQAWLRDQERAETKWEREQEQLRKDHEAEEERVAAEQADAQQQTANLSVYERLDDTTRCEHTQIVAGSGAGKTTLIEYDILKLLSRPNPPGIVVIDPKGLLIQRLQKLALFHPENGRLRDRLIIVDPAHSPALNMFDTSGFRVNENQTIDIFQYMFASKINALTPKQGTMFAFVARLLLSMKTATIHDLLDLCDDKSPSVEKSAFRPYIENLDRTSQRFFTNEYFGEKSEYASTKKEVKQRLYGLLRFPQLEAAFTPPKRRVDMFDAIQNRKIVLVNADYDGLSEDGCQLWGRTIIGLTLNAAFARSSLPQDQWHETFVYVDEAQLFMEQEKTPRFLQLAREYRVGITHAHQDIGACLTPKLATTLSENTAIKYAARIAGDDLKYVARDLKCEPEFIDAQRKDAGGARFACYIQGMTAPISVSIPWKPLESQPQMSADAHRRLVQLNKERFSAPSETYKATEVAKTQPPEPMPLKDASKPAQSEHSKEFDSSSTIGKAVAKQEQKSTPTVGGPLEPNEPSSDWKP